jgi:predicted acyltransferase
MGRIDPGSNETSRMNLALPKGDDAMALGFGPAITTDAGARQLDDPRFTIVGGSPIGAAETPPSPLSSRVVSVDVLRGFSMVYDIAGVGLALSFRDMLSGHGPILGAVGAFVGRQGEHAAWEGLHFYDFTFPLFVFVSGVAIVLSLPRLVERVGELTALYRVLTRSFLLFLLGFLYYGGVTHPWPDVRLLGVLQRIALCYLFTSLLLMKIRLRGLIVAFVVLVVGYWALMNFVPVPGIGAGSFARDANLASWIDLQLLPGRKWSGTLEPEGLLSTLPAIATCLLGVFAGLLLQNPRVAPQHKALWLVGAGIVLGAAGLLWGLQFPIIKSLWTSSYVLVTGGLSALLLGVFYQIIDVWGYRAWAALFVWIGTNAIALYLINHVVRFRRVATRLVGGDVGSFFDSHLTHGSGEFLANVIGLALAIALAGFLYRRRIFVRV